MTPRTGLVVELRFEMDGRLVEAFLPPLIPSDGSVPPASQAGIYWFIQINQGKAFRGPIYGIFVTGQEPAAEAEIRRYLEENPAALK